MPLSRELFVSALEPFSKRIASRRRSLDYSSEWMEGRFAMTTQGGATYWLGERTAGKVARLDIGITSEQTKAIVTNYEVAVRLRELFPEGSPMDERYHEGLRKEGRGFEKWLKTLQLPFHAGSPLSEIVDWAHRNLTHGVVTTPAIPRIEEWQREILDRCGLQPEELTRVGGIVDGLWLEFICRNSKFQALEITDVDLFTENMGCDESPADAKKLRDSQRELLRNNPKEWLLSVSMLTADLVDELW
jgi:hypothetical protein